jgi:Tfp pilus assembly protein PilF
MVRKLQLHERHGCGHLPAWLVPAVVLSLILFVRSLASAGPILRSATAGGPQNPQTAEQHLDLALAAIKAKDYGRAKKELKRAESMKKDLAEPYLWLD